jgi:hypothetical protein
VDEVDLAGTDEIVDDADRVLVNLLFDPAHVAWSERRADQPPVAGVFGWVHREEERGDLLNLGRHGIQGDTPGGGEQLRVETGERDVRPPRERPEPVLLHWEQGR